jgi:uncharacterized Zn finger protein (UPF0148 family)
VEAKTMKFITTHCEDCGLPLKSRAGRPERHCPECQDRRFRQENPAAAAEWDAFDAVIESHVQRVRESRAAGQPIPVVSDEALREAVAAARTAG